MTTEGDERLLQVFREHAILRGKFILASGKESSYYFDGRMITLWPEGAYLIGKKIFEICKEAKVEAVGGMTIGADPIAASVALVSYMEGNSIPAFIVRTDVKDHGTQKRIEGPLKAGCRVAIVYDVITSGGSVLRSIEAVEEKGCQVVKVIVVLDRQEGGSDEVRRKGYDFMSIFKADISGEVSLA